jgi:hypothetical protein
MSCSYLGLQDQVLLGKGKKRQWHSSTVIICVRLRSPCVLKRRNSCPRLGRNGNDGPLCCVERASDPDKLSAAKTDCNELPAGRYHLFDILDWNGQLHRAWFAYVWLLNGEFLTKLATLGPFPGLGDQDLDDDARNDDTPLPRDGQVIEYR